MGMGKILNVDDVEFIKMKLFTLLFAMPFFVSCNDSSLKTFNSAPEATITSHEGGSVVGELVRTEFKGRVSDSNHSNEDLMTTWVAGDEVICADVIPDEEGVSVCKVGIPVGATSLSLEVVDPVGGSGVAMINLEVVPTEAPLAFIDSPVPSGLYYADTKVSLSGRISDAEDIPEALIVSWESDIDGRLDVDSPADADGNVLGHSLLSEGEHALKLHVEDQTGKTAFASVVINVGPANRRPNCEITYPAPVSANIEGAMVTFEGTATDEDVSNDSLAVDWTSSLDGFLGTSTPNSEGGVVFPDNTLTMGTHVITMNVVDEMGDGCSDTIMYTVGEVPGVVILAPVLGAVGDEGGAVLFSATVVDLEDSATDLSLSWVSDRDGEFSTLGANSDGSINFFEDGLSRGAHTISLTVTDSHGLYATTSTTLTLNGVPSQPVIRFDPDVAFGVHMLTAVIDTPSIDPEGSPVVYSYAWTKDGLPDASTVTNTLGAEFTAKGETWRVSVTATDGTSVSPAGIAAITIQNTLPEVSVVTVSPTPAKAGDPLTCAWTYSDDDGDMDMSEAVWSVNGVTVSTAISLDGGYVAGDLVSCSVTPFDGESSATPVATAITIDNTAPYVDGLTLSPEIVSEGESLVCTPGEIVDPDGTVVTLDFDWFINGVLQDAETASLDSSYFGHGDTIVCAVTPNDGTEDGPMLVSNEAAAGNTLPNIDSVTITPSDVYANTPMTCEYTGFYDADGDADASEIVWTVNGSPVGSAADLETGFVGGDVVVCTVTPHDGVEAGAAKFATETVLNSVPSVGHVNLAPEPAYTNTTLICDAAADPDVDGESVILQYQWTLNGAPTGHAERELDGSAFVKDDVLRCMVTPFDGVDYGDMVESNTVSIQNSLPILTSIHISPTEAYEASTFYCAPGILSDLDDEVGLLVNYSWRVNGAELEVTTDYLSGEHFNKHDEVLCMITPYDGDEDGLALISDTVSVLNTLPTIASMEISPAPPVNTDTLNCPYVDYTDDDGDADLTTIVWTVNDVVVSTPDGSLPPTAFGVGDEVSCTVTPHDGEDAGISMSATEIVSENQLPTVSATVYWRTSEGSPLYSGGGRTNDTIYIYTTYVSDPDGDPTTLSYEWYVDGVLTDETGDALDGLVYFDRDQEVELRVYVHDGYRYGVPWVYTTVVPNAIPSIESVDVWPALATPGDTVTCVHGGYGDIDGDADQSITSWTINGTDAGTGETLEATTIVGDDVNCTVMAFDGTDNGNILSKGFTMRTSAWDDQTPLEYVDYIFDNFDRAGVDQLHNSAGDVDGDGQVDLLLRGTGLRVGSDESTQNFVGLIFGSSFADRSLIDAKMADYQFYAEGGLSSASISTAGDVDGDGLDDILIGNAYNDDGASDGGKVYLFLAASLGVDRLIDVEDADYTFTGLTANQNGGYTVDGTGDFDGDGINDLVIGGYLNTFIFFGADLGAPQDYFLYEAGAILDDGGYYFYAANVRVVGDINGDGLSDILFTDRGPYCGSGTGLMVVYSDLFSAGGEVDLRPTSPMFCGDVTKGIVTGVGDVDGDGLDDFMVGNPLADDPAIPMGESGAAYLVLGSTMAGYDAVTDKNDLAGFADYTFYGEGGVEHAARSVAGGTDVDGDGQSDFLIGAPQNDDNGSNAGKTYLFLGAELPAPGTYYMDIASYAFVGPEVYDHTGYRVSMPGDINGDGKADLVIGNQNSSPPGTVVDDFDHDAYLLLSPL